MKFGIRKWQREKNRYSRDSQNGLSAKWENPPRSLSLVGIVIVWAVSGSVFKFSDTGQLVINTGTTIVIFLMVFLIQNTQNRDTKALQLKLDELICAVKDASNPVLDLEELDEKDLDEIRAGYLEKARKAREEAAKLEKAGSN